MPEIETIITCEHASHQVPEPYAQLFSNAALLKSHQGWDIGASNVAQAIAKKVDAPLFLAEYSRLLIDLNRSIGHPKLFSICTKPLNELEKQAIIANYYSPYRNRVLQKMHQALENNHSLQHISVHSFTPVINGKSRNCDIGLLYDPSRAQEKRFALHWQKLLQKAGLNVRLNYPYQGVSDGFVTYLRKVNPSQRYLGIELEINQSFFDEDGRNGSAIIEQIVSTLAMMCREAN